MTHNELIMLQSLPLDVKIRKTELRIEEWVSHFGLDNVSVSFSGGKDSTVLLNIARNLYPDIDAVFVDTGLEYPELRAFVKTVDNVTILNPKMNFREVIKKYGYPVVTKEQADFIDRLRKNRDNPKIIDQYLNGIYKGKKTNFAISKKWQYLVDEAPFKISGNCCLVMKKRPLAAYDKKFSKVQIIGTLADESVRRKQSYMKNNCNGFDMARPQSRPLSFWTEQNILTYIKDKNLKIADCYGEIIEKNRLLKTTECSRTGCVFCLFGCHLEKEPNRIQSLASTHPKLYEYCLRDFDKGGLGLKNVMAFCNIPYKT